MTLNTTTQTSAPVRTTPPQLPKNGDRWNAKNGKKAKAAGVAPAKAATNGKPVRAAAKVALAKPKPSAKASASTTTRRRRRSTLNNNKTAVRKRSALRSKK